MAFPIHKQRITQQASKNFLNMLTEETHIAKIRASFEKIQSREDFLQLMNDAKPFVFGEKAYPFELKQLTWYANPKLCRKRYTEFKIKKKSGADRTIHAPAEGLKAMQKTLSFIIQCVFEPHEAAMGFVRGKSIVDNARIHQGSKYVYNIDLKDFFPSIDQARVWKCLQLKPFNLTQESSYRPKFIKWEDFKREKLKTDEPVQIFKGKGRLFIRTPFGIIHLSAKFDKNKPKYVLVGDKGLATKDGKSLDGTLWLVNHIPSSGGPGLANIIASLCCTEMSVERKNEKGDWVLVKRNVLPQGAPTSPVITNIVCQRLDYLLSGVAKRFGLKYSRYADDITFSSNHNVYQPQGDFVKELHRIITDQGFHVNESKTRLQKQGYRQEVTGLLVNEKANVQKRYIKELRLWLYYWERYGYNRAYGFFLQQYCADKGHTKKGRPDMANVLAGKLDYLRMVKGADNDLYIKIKARFTLLTADSLKPELSVTADGKSESEPVLNQVMITLERFEAPALIDKLNTSVSIPINTALPSTILIDNSDDLIPEPAPRKLFPHNPLYTVAFLKKFKIGDGSGFKELVHDVMLTEEFVKEIIDKVKSHPNFIFYFKKERVADVSFLNKGIQLEVRGLIERFEREGLPYFLNTGKHPYNNDEVYTEFAKEFKKKYRYGSGSEYSKLHADIRAIFLDQKLSADWLKFLPDERKFNIRTSFFTWQPSIFNGIRHIVQGISDHSNINGIRPFDAKSKEILIEAESITNDELTYLQISIYDRNSVSGTSSEMLMHFFKESKPYKEDFRNLCDWIVECDFADESSKRLNILTTNNDTHDLMEIEALPELVGGFKHFLKFYDVR